MKIIHSINSHQIERDIDDKENIGFLLTNGLGGYAAVSKANDSRYHGWFVSLDDKLYKIIDEIKLQAGAKIVAFENGFFEAGRTFDNGLSDNIFFPREKNSLVYELSEEGIMEIVLDVRESYDGRSFGRVYEITEEDGLTIVKYIKYRTWEEDKSEGKEYEIFIAINANGGKVEKIGEWAVKHYGYDERRSSRPFDKYIYRALKINAKKIVFSAALDKKAAKAEALDVFKKSNELKIKDKKRANRFVKRSGAGNEEVLISQAAAKNSLAGLLVENGKKVGIYAGLPWFFQFWTSDESICLKSISEIDKELAQKILLRDIGYINNDGKMYDLLNAKATGQYTLNMDAAGWLFKRAAEMIEEKVLDEKLIKNKIARVIDSLRRNYMRNGLVHSEAGETWMDTFYAGDIRDGARIEIQALMLSMYKEAYRFTKDEKYAVWEKELRDNVRKNFWNGKTLADGANDYTIRPNIFIAHYAYPELLSVMEWKECFKEALSHLWLSWGGVSTIDKTSPFYYNEYTGETPESYHRGDSWYWMNNLAALTLYRVDEYMFKDYIDKILRASSEELLWHGFLGHMAELSSAREQRSEGAWAQAWSAAMYMEALAEIAKPQEFLKVGFEAMPKKEIPRSMFVKTNKAGSAVEHAGAKYAASHSNFLKVYEIILVIVLLFSVSIAVGTAAFEATL